MYESAKVTYDSSVRKKLILTYTPDLDDNEYSFAAKVMLQVMTNYKRIRSGDVDIIVSERSH